MHSLQILRSAAYYIGVCLLSISFLVFVNASISFVITDVIQKRSNVGDNVGTLGFADEIVAMIACPIWGHISDRVGTRNVVTLGYFIIAVSLACFVQAKSVFPDLLLYRIIFGIGGSAVSTMVTAILPLYTERSRATKPVTSPRRESGGGCSDLNTEASRQATPIVQHINTPADSLLNRSKDSTSFRNAGVVGMAAGCGALLAVFGYLRLPPTLQERGMSAKDALTNTYYIIAVLSLGAAAFCLLGLRDLKEGKINSLRRNRSLYSSYTELPLLSLTSALRNQSVALAYLGGFVARASSVGISLFIPLWVNAFFVQSGKCNIDDPSYIKEDCREAYVLASILTGISQLAALLFAPLYGFISEKWHLHHEPLILSSLTGVVGYLTISSVSDPRLGRNTSTAITVISSLLLGISQIGATVCSLGLLGQEIVASETETPAIEDDMSSNESTEHTDRSAALTSGNSESDRDTEYNTLLTSSGHQRVDLSSIKGALAGTYSFVGGIGILLLTKFGGYLFDRSSHLAPFWLLAGFNFLLLGGSIAICLLRTVPGHSTRV